MLEGIEAVIFDLDGTIIDSMWAYPVIDRRFFEQNGKEFPNDMHQQLKGKTFTQACEHFKEAYGIEGTVDEIRKRWVQTGIDVFTNEVKLKKGAYDFIHKLHDQGMKIGIATQNSLEMTSEVVKAHKIDVFDTIKTTCLCKKGKPAPDVYLLAADALGVKPEKCLVFEDLVDGIQAGKNAGMKVCAVYDKYSESKDPEKKQIADYYVSSFDDVFAGTYEKLK